MTQEEKTRKGILEKRLLEGLLLYFLFFFIGFGEETMRRSPAFASGWGEGLTSHNARRKIAEDFLYLFIYISIKIIFF